MSTPTSRYLLEHIAIEDVRPTTHIGGGTSAETSSAEADGATTEVNRGVDVELREAYKAYQVADFVEIFNVVREKPSTEATGKTRSYVPRFSRYYSRRVLSRRMPSSFRFSNENDLLIELLGLASLLFGGEPIHEQTLIST